MSDAVLLEKMRGSLEVGWYSAPVRVLEGLTLIPRILGYAFNPLSVFFCRRADGGLIAIL